MRFGAGQNDRHIRGPSGWFFSVMFIIGLAVLGVLSVRQYHQIQQLKQANVQVRNDSNWVNHLVNLQRHVDREIEQSNQQVNEIASCSYNSEKIVADLSGGVCLIQGEYMFVDPKTGLPLRYADEAGTRRNQPFSPLSRGRQAQTSFTGLSIEGAGPPLIVQYTGTGFLIDRRGYIATNKHVTSPWLVAEEYQLILQAGYEVQMLLFRAFFPNHTKGFDLEVVRSAQEDLTMLHCRLDGTTIPVLPCADKQDALKVGQTVIVLGYPTGFDLLLARLGRDELDQIVGHEGRSFEEVAMNMAERHLIQPVATRGMCGRVSGGRIVYDALTAIGASGAPVIGSNGKVMAINTALLKGFAGTNFGIPIGRALEMMDQIAQEKLK